MSLPPLIPHEVLFGPAHRLAPTVSPDGRTLYFLAPNGGGLNVWAQPLGADTPAVPVTHARGRGVLSFGLCHDDRTLFYLVDHDGDEGHVLFLVELATGREWCATPFPGVQVRVLAHNRWHPTTMLLGINRDRRDRHDVYRLDVGTGAIDRVADNPGYVSWIIDTELTVRGGTRWAADGSVTIDVQRPGQAEPEPRLVAGYGDVAGTRVLGFTRDGSTLHLLSSVGANTSRLVAMDVTTGHQSVLAADAMYDVKRVEFDPETLRPQAVVFAKEREHRLFLDDRYAADLDRVRNALGPAGEPAELDISRSERSGRIWTVAVVRPDAAVGYHLYDRASGALDYLFAHQPDLADYQLAPMEPFRCTARDGVALHGYATWPPGRPRSGLPAVVNVHGGPWARNSYCFDEEAQLLANRGYLCIQVNYRGSTGYGKAFHQLGAKQWAAGMHGDILATVDHFVSSGAADPTRIAIMGCSFGGYAALVGASFSPDVFACAIDLCGPANLLTMLTNGNPYRAPLQTFMHQHVGDPVTERDMLWARSPLSRIADIRIPILIGHAANDVRVTQDEADHLVAELRARDVPCEYLLFADDGHGLRKPANRETYYRAVERFLHAHLGAPSTAAVGAGQDGGR